VKRPRYRQGPVRPSSSAVAMLPRKRLTPSGEVRTNTYLSDLLVNQAYAERATRRVDKAVLSSFDLHGCAQTIACTLDVNEETKSESRLDLGVRGVPLDYRDLARVKKRSRDRLPCVYRLCTEVGILPIFRVAFW